MKLRWLLIFGACRIGHTFLSVTPPKRSPTNIRVANLDASNKAPRQRKGQQRPKKRRSEKRGRETWRVYGIEVHPDRLTHAMDPALPADKRLLEPAVLEAVLDRLRLKSSTVSLSSLPPGVKDIRLVRRSLDARLSKRRSDGEAGPRFVYVVDVDLNDSGARAKHQPGRMELLPDKIVTEETVVGNGENMKRVIIVGAGPAGLFCALQLARTGRIQPILLERGQPVESRGKDIGALVHRRSLDSESNFAFGEGGAGTWSDGKLTTRIGRNSDAVRFVLETLVAYGAPDEILVHGSPHLGTDNLVRLLRNMRRDLRKLGGEIRFGCKVTGLLVEDGVTKGVDYVAKAALERNMEGAAEATALHNGGRLYGDAVVLASGHSARDVYQTLHELGIQLEPKGFAVGFRVEHPQHIINKIQYGTEWGPSVLTGKTKTDAANQEYFAATSTNENIEQHSGKLPVPSYRLATDQAFDGHQHRGVYSFCMCPGGQIVPASTDSKEVCVNGMSFSRRDSLWANSALVVTVSPDDAVLDPYRQRHGVLAGLAFQRDMEQRASAMGGGNLTVPVQRLTDFLAGRPSTSAPSSSYRLGVKPAACHEIYPPPLISAMRSALTDCFDKQMPGFVCEEGLLHAVETRTSSPLRIPRDDETLQAIGAKCLFPAGEGAGFAGGIVSAAVDGLVVAEAVIDQVLGTDSHSQQKRSTSRGIESFY